jgi:uncharacterized Zn finger protein (UPF0148 family)
VTTITCKHCGASFTTEATTNTRCRVCKTVVRVPQEAAPSTTVRLVEQPTDEEPSITTTVPDDEDDGKEDDEDDDDESGMGLGWSLLALGDEGNDLVIFVIGGIAAAAFVLWKWWQKHQKRQHEQDEGQEEAQAEEP